MSEIGPTVLRKIYVIYGKFTQSSKTYPGGPIRAHMAPCGPIYGPIWAPTRTGQYLLNFTNKLDIRRHAKDEEEAREKFRPNVGPGHGPEVPDMIQKKKRTCPVILPESR